MTGLTGTGVHELLRPFTYVGRSLLGVLRQNEIHNALETVGGGVGLPFTFRVGKGHRSFRTIQDAVERLFRNLPDRGVQRETVAMGHLLYLTEHPVVFVFPQRSQSAFTDTFFRIGHQFVEIDRDHLPQAVAMRARAVWRIEGECVRLRFRIGDAGRWAHQETAEEFWDILCDIHDHQSALTEFHGCLYRFQQTLPVFLPHIKGVDHHFNVMSPVPVYLHPDKHLLHDPVYAGIEETPFQDLLENFTIVSFSTAHKR